MNAQRGWATGLPSRFKYFSRGTRAQHSRIFVVIHAFFSRREAPPLLSRERARARARSLIYDEIVPSIYRPKNRGVPSTRRKRRMESLLWDGIRHVRSDAFILRGLCANPPLHLSPYHPSRTHNLLPYPAKYRGSERVMYLSHLGFTRHCLRDTKESGWSKDTA